MTFSAEGGKACPRLSWPAQAPYHLCAPVLHSIARRAPTTNHQHRWRSATHVTSAGHQVGRVIEAFGLRVAPEAESVCRNPSVEGPGQHVDGLCLQMNAGPLVGQADGRGNRSSSGGGGARCGCSGRHAGERLGHGVALSEAAAKARRQSGVCVCVSAGHACLPTCVHARMHAGTHACTNARMHACTHACMHARMLARACLAWVRRDRAWAHKPRPVGPGRAQQGICFLCRNVERLVQCCAGN